MKKLKLVALIGSFILTMYIVAMSSGLRGRRGGPPDVFRHTIASAYTAKYVSPKIVDLVTIISERDPDSSHDQMGSPKITGPTVSEKGRQSRFPVAAR